MTPFRPAPFALLLLAAACAKEEPAPTYQAVAVETRDIAVSAQAAGAILPDTVVEVKSKASGEILDFPVQTGQVVTRGTLLARIDRRAPQNQYAQATAQLDVAQAQLRNAEAQLKRSQELFAARAITEQELETTALAVANAKASVINAQVQVENAKIALDDTEVRAPIAGTVIAKNVERGAVISSPVSDVGGGTVLLKMADLSLVQVKTYVDETDIGKLRAGMPANVTVQAFPNRPFRGEVLKIEPQADTVQNVTMFPVLVRIDNREGLLKPGMNAEVRIDVGNATGVLAVPNAALRTERDVASAAGVLGIAEADLQVMLEAAKKAEQQPTAGGDSGKAATLPKDGSAKTYTMPDGREVPLPEGVTAAQVDAIMAKFRTGSRPNAAEMAILGKLRGNGGGRGGNGNAALFGGKYIVFALRDGKPTPVYIQTGITDLDWSEVKSGLTAQDSVLLLPSASLIQSQQGLQERMGRMSGLPGQSSGSGSSSQSGGAARPAGNR
ncbi:MAG TPA: efflux RND transporter periplasmic adaptor subunit [Gemmatimonadales bacterium]|nr:efflux RND transporter periplasmic adaptor subunit [Gemmatimonadales bacterium]